MNSKFLFLGPSHISVLVLTVILTLGFIYTARRSPNSRLSSILGYILGLTLFIAYIAYNVQRYRLGYWDLRFDLPMEFCDWAGIAVIVACFTRNVFAFELSYFWVMAGSIHGTLTPNLKVDFPNFFFFIYFISHICLVIASFYFLFGWGMRPGPGSFWRVLWFSEFYFISALIFDLFLNTNYGYLMRKPENPSFLDYLGEWPYYLFSLQGLIILMFILLYLPFYSPHPGQREKNA